MNNEPKAPAPQPKDCRCGHTKGAHYNGLGVCRMEGGTGHICRCNRYCPAVYEEPIVPENPNSDKHHVAAKEQLQYEPKAPAPDMEPYQKLYERKAKQVAGLIAGGHQPSVEKVARLLAMEDKHGRA